MKMLHGTLLIVALVSVNALDITSPIWTDLEGAKCLDVKDSNYENGSPIEINDCSNIAQVWTMTKDSSGAGGEIRTGDLCWDAINVKEGNNVELWECNQSLQQQWNFSGFATYNYKSPINLVFNTSLCLDLPGSSTENGKQVQTYECNDGQNQVWDIVKFV